MSENYNAGALEGAQVGHLLDRCDERIQPFHVSVGADFVSRHTVTKGGGEDKCVTLPAITQQPTWGGDLLQIDNLGVLEGGCESSHARHVLTIAARAVLTIVGEEVAGQAESKSRQKAHSCFRV